MSPLPPPDSLTAPSRTAFLDADRKRLEEFKLRSAERRTGKKQIPPKLPPFPPLTESEGKTHLVIGDSHYSPSVPNHRAEWLGRAIVGLKPDVVVDIGDWWDMESLNSYDKPGSKSFEGRRYWLDVEAGIDAMERVRIQLDVYNKGRRKKYKPRFIRTLGNHENRIIRLLEDSPRLEGVLGLEDLLSKEFNWETHEFGVPVEIDGVTYCHYFTSGVMGRPIGGIHPAASLLAKQFTSCIQGHNHLFDYSEKTDAGGKKIIGMDAGCFFTHDLGWAPHTVNRMYGRGLLVLRNVKNGAFGHEWITIEEVQRRFS